MHKYTIGYLVYTLFLSYSFAFSKSISEAYLTAKNQSRKHSETMQLIHFAGIFTSKDRCLIGTGLISVRTYSSSIAFMSGAKISLQPVAAWMSSLV